MAQWLRLRCKNRHWWKWDGPPKTWPPDFRSSCPVCGDGPIAVGILAGRWLTIARITAASLLLCLAGGLAMIFIGIFIGALRPFFVEGLVFAFCAATTLLLMGAMRWVRRQRTKKTVAIAEQMGFAFVPYAPVRTIQAVAPFRLFTQTGWASDAMQGRVGDCAVLVFDYRYYIVRGGRIIQNFYQSAVILFDAVAGVPDFFLAPKAFFDKQVGLFAPRVIALEGAEEFDKRCALTGPDEAALRQTFHPELVRNLGQEGQWFIETVNGQLLLYRSPKVPPDKRPDLLTDALEIRDLLLGAGPLSAAEGTA